MKTLMENHTNQRIIVKVQVMIKDSILLVPSTKEKLLRKINNEKLNTNLANVEVEMANTMEKTRNSNERTTKRRKKIIDIWGMIRQWNRLLNAAYRWSWNWKSQRRAFNFSILSSVFLSSTISIQCSEYSSNRAFCDCCFILRSRIVPFLFHYCLIALNGPPSLIIRMWSRYDEMMRDGADFFLASRASTVVRSVFCVRSLLFVHFKSKLKRKKSKCFSTNFLRNRKTSHTQKNHVITETWKHVTL